LSIGAGEKLRTQVDRREIPLCASRRVHRKWTRRKGVGLLRSEWQGSCVGRKPRSGAHSHQFEYGWI